MISGDYTVTLSVIRSARVHGYVHSYSPYKTPCCGSEHMEVDQSLWSHKMTSYCLLQARHDLWAPKSGHYCKCT